MTDLDLRSELERLLVDEPPMTESSSRDCMRGRRYRRRRQVTMVTLAAVVVGAVALGANTLMPRFEAAPPATRTLSADAVLDECRQIKDNGALSPALFGPGSRVITSAASIHGTSAVILSGDSTYWADCWINADSGGEFTGRIDQYQTDPSLVNDPHDGFGGDYRLHAAWFRTVVRFLADVAEVHLRFRGGPTLVAKAAAGFVVFDSDDQFFWADSIDDSPPTPRVVLYDEAGNVLASGTTGRITPASYGPMDKVRVAK